MIEAVLFDAGGVLVRPEGDAPQLPLSQWFWGRDVAEA